MEVADDMEFDINDLVYTLYKNKIIRLFNEAFLDLSRLQFLSLLDFISTILYY
mgnify:CR=1 FL=1